MENMEKKKSFIITLLYWGIIAAAVYLILKKAVFILMPFLLAFLIAATVEPVIKFLIDKFNMKRKPTAILILLIFYATAGMLITMAVIKASVAIGTFIGKLPELYSDSVEPFLNQLYSSFTALCKKLGKNQSPELFEALKSSLSSAVSEISVSFVSGASAFISRIPEFLISVLFLIISSFFITVDYDRLCTFLKSRLPSDKAANILRIKEKLRVSCLSYLKSYALILLITFAELCIGLSLIGIKNAFAVSLVIALLDILPIVGTGSIMLPWALISFFKGNTALSVELLVIWLIISIVRNIIEPKIVGKHVGLNPLAALLSMYVGAKLFGIIGLFVFPVAASLVAELFFREEADG